MISIFALQRIKLSDQTLPFSTGKNSFDQINPSGTLKEYINQDEISGGEYITYLFIEKINPREVLGVIRYKNITIEELCI